MVLFDQLVYAHIVTGAVGLITLWVPIIGRKGSVNHKRWGKLFARCLLATGFFAVGISICSLLAPLETHPFADDAALVRGLFGWMMMYLAVLTINLSWYGRLCVRNKHQHHRNRHWLNFLLQFLTLVLALNCAWHGWHLGQPIMLGIAVVGIAFAMLATRFILRAVPPPNEWLIQHTRGLVGAGISVYTAFFAFGAVNLMPQLAFNPVLWATPTVLGMSLLLYHQFKIVSQRRSRHAQLGAALGVVVKTPLQR